LSGERLVLAVAALRFDDLRVFENYVDVSAGKRFQ